MSLPSAPSWSRASALVVAATLFMEQLDGTVLFTAIPSIGRDFHIAAANVAIATTAYLVASATFIPLGGWLASRLGGRRLFVAAIALFALASLGCALSPNIVVLTAFRLLQGFGGAMMVPVGRLVVLRKTDPANLIRAIAYITWPGLLAPVVAPLVGGLVTTTVGWRWIFIINVPLGVVAAVIALRVLTPTRDAPRPLDRLGLLLSTVAIFALIAAIELAPGTNAIATTLTLSAVFVATVIPALVHLDRVPDPLMNLRVYSVGTFRAANASGLAYRLAITSTPFLIPLFAQGELGYGPLESGVLVAAIFIGNVGIKPLTTPLLHRLGFKAVLLTSTIAGSGFLIAFAFVDRSTPTWLLAATLLLSGVFRSIGFTAYATIQFADMPSSLLESANTLSATVQQLSAALGIAIASTVLVVAQHAIHGDGLLPYRLTFLVMALIAVIAIAGSVSLRRGAADHLRRRSTPS